MAVVLEKRAVVEVSAMEFVAQCGVGDIAEFASEVALKLDRDFVGRAKVASAFADGLSEQGCRWLAEVVTQFYARQDVKR